MKGETGYAACILGYVSVKQKRSSLSETVVTVLDQEIQKLYGGKDSNTLNNEFLERNSNSVLHRAAGESRVSGVRLWGKGYWVRPGNREIVWRQRLQHTQQWVHREK